MMKANIILFFFSICGQDTFGLVLGHDDYKWSLLYVIVCDKVNESCKIAAPLPRHLFIFPVVSFRCERYLNEEVTRRM